MNPLTPYPITPIGCFLGFVLALLPLPLQIQSCNIGVLMYGLWMAVANFIYFVNTIVWHNNVDIVATVWCDIVTRIQFVSAQAASACGFVICIHLYQITRRRASSISTTKATKRNIILRDLCLTLGFPLLVMGLYIIIQPYRFEVVEEIGCMPVEFSFVTYIIVYLPALAFSIASLCIAPFTLRVFLMHRKEMNEFLASDESISSNRYKRLILIACFDTLINLPITIVSIVESVVAGKAETINYPYGSWSNAHSEVGGLIPGVSFGTIAQAPASVWSTNKWEVISIKWDEWLYVVQAIAFFAAFGTTPEMRRHFHKVFWFLPKMLGYKKKIESEKLVSEIRFHSSPGPGSTTWEELSNNTANFGTLVKHVHTTEETSCPTTIQSISSRDDHVTETDSTAGGAEIAPKHDGIVVE